MRSSSDKLNKSGEVTYQVIALYLCYSQKSAPSLSNNKELQRKLQEIAQHQQHHEQKAQSIDFYFKKSRNSSDTYPTTCKAHLSSMSSVAGRPSNNESSLQFKTFDNRTFHNYRIPLKVSKSRNASMDKLKSDSQPRNKQDESRYTSSIERSELTRKKGSRSNLRGSTSSNIAITRKASHSFLQRYKF